jgi:hypothetical protein
MRVLAVKTYSGVVLLVLLFAEFAIARTINVPQDQYNISSAILEAGDGDTILVAPGRYVENIIIENKKVVLLSHFVLDQSFEIISQTIIDGSVPDNPAYAPGIRKYCRDQGRAGRGNCRGRFYHNRRHRYLPGQSICRWWNTD